MARTRSKGAAETAASSDKKSAAANKASPSIYTLTPESSNPPKLFVLPKTASSSARIATLQHPRYGRPARYVVCPEAGFFEFTSISPSKSAPRSWLIQPNNPKDALKTQITQSSALHLATPFDPLFLLLPALCSNTSPSASEQKRMFLSLEDHLDALPDQSNHLADLLRTQPAVRRLLEARLAAVCDAVQAGDEDMYRLSETKLVREVWGKAKRMVEGGGGLPASMEERFVRRDLEAPVLGVRVARVPAAVVADENGIGIGSATPDEESAPESQESVSSVETAASLTSEASVASTTATSVSGGQEAVGGSGTEVASAMTASDEVIKLQRLKVAFSFICSSYVASGTAAMLRESLAKATDLVDFKPLDDYLARLAKLRQEAAESRTTDFSRKRAADEEDDERAEKRRKKEAEEKAKKASMSRGVKELMKVNTSGMQKLSAFFKKKA